eukprot:397172_1
MAAVRLLFPVAFILSAFIYTATCKSALLTPHNTVTDGAWLFYNINDVIENNNLWHVNVWTQNSWDFIISLDNTYGIDPSYRSSVSITVNAPYAVDELLFGITTNNDHFVSMAVPMFSQSESNQIYPACVPSLRSTSSFASGDIAGLPSTNRKCDIAHGSCAQWRHVVPAKYNIQMPITFTLEHDPSTQILEIYFSDAYTTTVQRCSFASGFSLDTGLKVYLSGTNPGDSYIIESFEVSSTSLAPTPPPTAPQTTTTNVVPSDPAKPTSTNANPHTNSPTMTSPIHSTLKSTTIPIATQPAITTTAAPLGPSPPPGFVWNVFNQLCPIDVTTSGRCRDVADIHHTDTIQCLLPYDCCMCAQIECGLQDLPCQGMTAGASGVAGVKDITIVGAAAGTGAVIECQGADSCSNTDIIGTHVFSLDCDEDRACYNATIIITDPSPLFTLNCGGIESCRDLDIQINFSAPDTPCSATAAAKTFTLEKLSCASDMACENLHITINNAGCDTVVMDTFECVHPKGCDGAVVDLIGAVEIINCECGPSCLNAVGLGQCYEGLSFLQCNDPRACAGQVSTVTNPENGFEFICGDVSSCEGAQFTMELTHDIREPTSQLGKFIFGENILPWAPRLLWTINKDLK